MSISLSLTTLYNFQRGGTFQNYDMYHGGTNFDRTAGGPYIATSYDYDAPLDEYDNKAQPKWSHLKELHRILKSMEESLTNGNVSQIDFGKWQLCHDTKIHENKITSLHYFFSLIELEQ
ncbi:beta-galactosidase-like [Arachis ipaensis]|uniref:beta-galactosidase-like n=1 Tax=Arachis ipaensis TaxID=130454 RepID=UPI000A2B0D30|nr:beta-galactosidase-like [Arachis ipaensis]